MNEPTHKVVVTGSGHITVRDCVHGVNHFGYTTRADAQKACDIAIKKTQKASETKAKEAMQVASASEAKAAEAEKAQKAAEKKTADAEKATTAAQKKEAGAQKKAAAAEAAKTVAEDRAEEAEKAAKKK